nr:reverse transcriptase domain-containing protein [Tanacetum cinerariifolium]
RVLVTRPHVGIGSFDVNAATRPQVSLGTLQQSRFSFSLLTDDWTCRIKRCNDASHAVDGGKLGPKWEGPYEVTEALGDEAYKLRSMDGTILPKTWNIAFTSRVIFLIMLHGGYFESLEGRISSVIHGTIYAMLLAFLPGVNKINNMEASLMEEVNVYTLRLKVLPLSNAVVTAVHKRILRVYVLQL